ncbi:MAG: AraC family transcriptional regulator [Betaproteobacteria bacterium]|nr:AraC family transcriptional regulator [Betaproteobacteria bacterium]
MELPGWNAGHAPPCTTPNFERFHTRDIEEARLWGARVFCENELLSLDARGQIDARTCYRRLGGVGIGRISYGGNVTISPRQFDTFYLVQMPLRGGECIDSGGQTTYSSPTVSTVLNAQQQLQIRHGVGTEKLVVRIDRDLLERQCSQHLGRSVQHRIEFETSMPLDSPAGKRWMRTVSWLFDCLDNDAPFASPLLTAQIEQMIVAMLLVCQRNNQSAAFQDDSRVITPAFVRRAELFIEEHAHEPITVCDMAEHVGVSTRSLYNGFRKYRNISPMLLLKENRLRRVREQLLQSDVGQTTVTAVAYQWGFTHLGHFTTDYKRWFGESPSETLAR